MFLGANQLNLDEKGRISIPARHREKILATCGGRFVTTVAVDEVGCLMIYPFPEWERIEEKLMSMPNMDPQVRRIQRLLMGYAHEVEMTAQGRILIAPVLREFANLQKQVTLVGQGRKFELWDTDRWRAQTDAWIKEAAEQKDEPSDALVSLQL